MEILLGELRDIMVRLNIGHLVGKTAPTRPLRVSIPMVTLTSVTPPAAMEPVIASATTPVMVAAPTAVIAASPAPVVAVPAPVIVAAPAPDAVAA